MAARNDMTGFLLTHELIRRRVPELAERLAGAACGDTGRIRRLIEWWQVFESILERHHEVEDRLVWPVALAVAPRLRTAADEIEAQHARLDGHLTAIDTGLRDLAGTAGRTPGEWASAVAALTATITDFEAMMREHLLLEERAMVPVLEDVVPSGDFAALGARLAAEHSPQSAEREMPMVVEPATERQRAVMLARMPEPVRRRFLESWEPGYQRLVRSLPPRRPAVPRSAGGV